MSSQPKLTLIEHCTNLHKNPNKYIIDKDRAIKRFAETSYKYYKNLGKKKNIIRFTKTNG